MPKSVNNRFDRNRSREKKQAPQDRLTEKELEEGMRLNKYIAHCGICSRRKAAEYIKSGHVKVNDVLITEAGHRVVSTDKVLFRDELIKPEEKLVYLLMNKPVNHITTVKDEMGRRTVMDLIDAKEVPVRVYPVGRLDRATTGLLMLTNDGDLARKLSHPSFEVKKIYHVVLDKLVTEEDLEKIKKGLTLEDGPVEVDGVSYVKGKNRNEVGIELHIGRNRIVRRIFEHLYYNVEKLDRVYYAGLTKLDLPRGRYRFLTEKEVIMLKHFL